MEKVRNTGAALRRLGEKGQNTVEYLMMLFLVVGLVGVVGVLFKGKIGGIVSGIMNNITQAGSNLTNTGNGGN